jgi:hypothetical protein
MEKALTKDEFAEKYGKVFGMRCIEAKIECLSDLNALLRNELILHAEYDWRRTFDKSDLVPALSWELNKEMVINDIDKYLKSAQQ